MAATPTTRPVTTILLPSRPAAPTTTTTTTKTTAAPSLSHAFSTSSAAHATTSTGKAGVHQRGGKRMSMAKFKKKKDIVRHKSPAVGERRAMRKRIVLSNNNALRVDHLPRMDERNLAARDSVGLVFKLPEDPIDQLRKVEAFKSSQTWNLFHSPHMLVRAETVQVCARMSEAAEQGTTARVVLSGDKAAGKSMLLLQAMTHAFLNNWVVISIPEAQELTTASTEYGPIPDTSPQLWMQSVYMLRLMKTIASANTRVLETIYTTRSYEDFANPVVEGATLNTLIESAREADQAWPVFEALWYELFSVAADGDGKPRPPILFAIDGLAAVMRTSAYLTPAVERIHSHDLALVRMFVDVFSGRTPLPNGGAVVAATCRSNAARNASMELAIARQLARQAGAETLPPRDPYSRKYDARVDEVMEDTGLHVVDVKGISKAEARALMEYWAASGLLRAKVDESTVSEKWMTGGNGIIGEMERSGLLTLRV
ncbi:unnamed protein product [Discula destructiva]